jgi:hypothetical protein
MIIAICFALFAVGYTTGYLVALIAGDRDYAALYKDTWRLKQGYDFLINRYTEALKRLE